MVRVDGARARLLREGRVDGDRPLSCANGAIGTGDRHNGLRRSAISPKQPVELFAARLSLERLSLEPRFAARGLGKRDRRNAAVAVGLYMASSLRTLAIATRRVPRHPVAAVRDSEVLDLVNER